MSLRSTSARLSLAFCFLIFATVSANASSFSINIIGVFNVNLSAPGFSLQGVGQTIVSGVPGHGFSGPPGSVINLNGGPGMGPADFSFGFANVNGTGYQIFPGFFAPPGQVAVQFGMNNISGGSVAIPIGSTDPTLVLTAPIIATTFVRGTTGLFTTVFQNSYIGEGTYSITLVRQSSGDYVMQSVGYQFVTNPIPEPTTLILFGSGVLGIITTKLRRR